ncbi:asparaginase [Carnobacteriaceae bacterium zg-C25]|nr:asparaginase [Carnobacteriaceae bacterium zg-C25]
MKKLLLLHTGGTISMQENETTGHVTPTQQNPLITLSKQFGHLATLEQESIFQLPSPHITPKEMFVLKTRIERAIQEGYDGIVVTHGTDTLEETAYFLDLTVGQQLPIVITGAMRPSNELGSDGLINLQNAILVALDANTVEKGVVVVMNDEIHSAKYVTKTHTTNLATFQTPTFGPLGIISKNRVLYFQHLTTHERYNVDALNHQNIHLIKAYSGISGELFDAVNTPHTNGVIIEALGAGNLPPSTLPAIDRLLSNNIPIVLVSRAFNGVTQDVYDYEGGGKQLRDKGIIFTTGLSGQKARLKLMVLLNTSIEQPIAHYFAMQ